MQMREIATVDELRHCCADDALLMWAGQGLRASEDGRRVRAWRRGNAVAVAAPNLSCRDRLAIGGPAQEVAPLVRNVLGETGPTFRPVGSAALVEAVASSVEGLEVAGRFGWMETGRPVVRPVESDQSAARWLDAGCGATVAALLADAHPHSYARPGRPGVRRWAGFSGPDGALAAVAADAWSAPQVGYVAGVAARPTSRGKGCAAAVFGLVVDALVAEHGRAALMVNGSNTPAVRLYLRAGLSWRALAAAQVVSRRGPAPAHTAVADAAS